MPVLTDPVADFLTRFKNACGARLEEFTAPHSRVKVDLARILEAEGYIWNYEVVTTGKYPQIKVKVKYAEGRPVLTDLKRVSRPGRRNYVGTDEIPQVLNGLGIAILSTSRGMMTGARARREKIGGELIAYVW